MFSCTLWIDYKQGQCFGKHCCLKEEKTGNILIRVAAGKSGCFEGLSTIWSSDCFSSEHLKHWTFTFLAFLQPSDYHKDLLDFVWVFIVDFRSISLCSENWKELTGRRSSLKFGYQKFICFWLIELVYLTLS